MANSKHTTRSFTARLNKERSAKRGGVISGKGRSWTERVGSRGDSFSPMRLLGV